MPCYDSRDHEPAPFDHHNNPTAELLCLVMKTLEANPGTRVGDLGLLTPASPLWHWWEDHKERDRKKAVEYDRIKSQRIKDMKNEIIRLEDAIKNSLKTIGRKS